MARRYTVKPDGKGGFNVKKQSGGFLILMFLLFCAYAVVTYWQIAIPLIIVVVGGIKLYYMKTNQKHSQ